MSGILMNFGPFPLSLFLLLTCDGGMANWPPHYHFSHAHRLNVATSTLNSVYELHFKSNPKIAINFLENDSGAILEGISEVLTNTFLRNTRSLP